ncbi:Protein asteroid homolog 1 [Eumeta japonica]|uniref:Protein asteroid homolog 1 n=1 Tax=Eumeta variegata TaxID=151549 RepID=A0A4C1X9H0_EUMVA|nr:Protein asteroid homolog 1 [Eumeta japonica]
MIEVTIKEVEMRIKGLAPYIINSNDVLEEYTLEKCDVVIDAQNFFYSMYKDSGYERFTGGEYDKYADYIKEKLKCFQKNTVTPYFIFKGGHSTNLERRIAKYDEQVRNAMIVINEVRDPLLSRDVAYQVLDELGLKYAISEFESKKNIVDLAIALKCPIISFDIEYCFYPTDYIPYTTISFGGNKLKCQIYRLEKFLNHHRIPRDALAVFGAMLDQNIFPEGYFNMRLQQLKRVPTFKNIKVVLSLLKGDTRKFRQSILNNITEENKQKFKEAESSLLSCLNYKGNRTFLVDYVLHGKLEFGRCDVMWFEKGVCSGRIAIPYVNLVKHRTLLGSSAIENIDMEDSSALSLDIVRYAYDLLSNYDGSTFTFICRDGTNTKRIEVTNELPIKKSDMVTANLFKNGWTDFTPLFDLFLQSMKVDPAALEQLPANARIFMVSLIYFNRKGKEDEAFLYSLMLCYVLLSTSSSLRSRHNIEEDSITETTASGTAATEADYLMAAKLTKKYFTAVGNRSDEKKMHHKLKDFEKRLAPSDRELIHKLDRKTLHLIVQFEFCLANMNYLNNLCATKYPPAVYHYIINGTFVYNLAQQLRNEEFPLLFIKKLLSEAPTILTLFLKLVDFCKGKAILN